MLNFKANESLINVRLEDLQPVIDAAKSNNEAQVTQALIESTKGKFKKNHINIFDVTFEDGVCECSIWDEIKHDYILEFAFDL